MMMPQWLQDIPEPWRAMVTILVWLGAVGLLLVSIASMF